MDRLEPLTGLRGIAAYSVLIAHAIDRSFTYGGASLFGPFAHRLAYFGMSLFFVLSGFVIHYNYAAAFARDPLPGAAYRFFVARFARLYPLYAVIILVRAPQLPIPVFSDHGWSALAYLTLTQSWFNVETAIFDPAWSLSTEWFFYLAFIPLSFVVARITRPVLTLVVFLAAAAAGLAALFSLYGDPLIVLVSRVLWTDKAVSAPPSDWLLYFSPLVRLGEFVAGMLAAKAYRALPAAASPSPPAMLILLAAPAWCLAVVGIGPLTGTPPLASLLSNFVFAPALAPLLICCCRYESRLGRLLATRVLVAAGEISYSVYIWSFVVLAMLNRVLSAPGPSPLAYFNSTVRALICVGMTTVCAYGSYRLIEVPSRRWLRAVLTRRSRHPGETRPFGPVAVADRDRPAA